ncbi:DAK2 domain-containing protein [Cellulomonas sp. P5_C5]
MDLLEAAAVRAWAVAARTALEGAADRIDAVNVFPVADSDTGTNVLLTVVGGADAVASVAAGATSVDVARAFGRGALLAARGNSGVIVSQYLTGFARALPERAGAREVAHALAAAARAARGATVEPQEGTVLTLADVVADAASTAADAGATLATMLAEAVAEALRGLGRISALHPVLRAARVLDAGACALLVVLDALARAVGDERPVQVPLDWLPTTAADHASVEPAGGAYEVMLLVSDDGTSEAPVADTGARLRRRMGRLGDSVAVVGGDGWWHVHVHTDEPTAAIAAAALGRREQVLVRLLAGAHAGGSAHHDRADGRERWGVVVCTAAPDLAAWYAASGAVVLVRCPEAPVRSEHLERAVTDTGAARVVLLPGTGAEVPTELSVPGVVVQTLDAADEVRAVVGSLALAGEGPTALGCSAAEAALTRLGVGTVDVASARGATEVVDALVRAPRATPGESLTMLWRDAPDDGVLDAVVAHLAAHHPGVEATAVGPTGHGPALVLGLD